MSDNVKYYGFLFLTLLSFLFCGITNTYAAIEVDFAKGAPGAIFNQSPHMSKGEYGDSAARVDTQITLKIPVGKSQEVYRYLRATYVDGDVFIKNHFPNLNLKAQQRVDISEFTDEYFDTRNLDFYKIQSSVRHRIRVNTTDSNDRKSGRELVQIKYTPPEHFELRTEVKFETRDSSQTRQGLMGLIKKDQREEFKAAISKMGFNPEALRYILTNNQKRSRVYLEWDGKGFLSFSVDEFHTKVWWVNAVASSVDIGLQESDFTAANADRRQKMWEIRNLIVDDLKQNFPYLTQNSDEKYAILLSQISAKIPFFSYLAKLGLL